MTPRKIIVFVDGAARGNPGEAGAGIVIKDGEGKFHKRVKKYLGRTTNNQAEYSALIIALKESKTLGKDIKIFSDSELMVRQIKGIYKVKNMGLRPMYDEVKILLKEFSSWDIVHVPREENTEADSLANEAIDTAGS